MTYVHSHCRTALGGVVGIIAIALLATAFALSQRPAQAVNLATITATDSNAFTNNDQTGNVGDGLVFAWSGGGHTATAVGGQFSFALNSEGDSGSYTLQASDVGTVWYYCTIHATATDADEAGLAAGAMVGRVVVSQQATATATTATATATTATTTATTATATSTPTSTATPTATSTATTVPPTATPTTPAGATSPATAAPGPPATGSGSVSGTSTAALLILAGLGSIAVTGGALIAIRRRA